MSPSRRSSHRPDSRLLAALPRDVLERLEPQFEKVQLDFKEAVNEPGQPISHVYFPGSGIVSMVIEMENGDAVEVATIGREGFVGLPVLFESFETPRPVRLFSQVPGDALRMGVDAFQEALRAEPPLRSLLLRYASTFFMQIAQSAACNRLHTIDERCSRWLLMSHDRVGADDVPLTQEFLAQMLGVRRVSVNGVTGLLQKAGLIRYARGRIRILDRKGLEATSCECYRVIQKEYERLLGSSVDEGGTEPASPGPHPPSPSPIAPPSPGRGGATAQSPEQARVGGSPSPGWWGGDG